MCLTDPSVRTSEPYAIELRYDHLAQPAPTSRHHPHLWSLLRDRARGTLIAELALRRVRY